MRRILIALCFVGLVPIGITDTVGAATFGAGQACKVVNQQRTVAGIKYRCVKSGKKLTWKRTKATRSALPSATPVPTASPSPAPLQPWQTLYASIIDRYVSTANSRDFAFEFILSPTINQTKAKQTIDAYSRAMRFWTSLYPASEEATIRWILMTEKDYAWWKKTVTRLEGDRANYAWDPVTNVVGHCKLSSTAFCGYGNNHRYSDGYKFFQYNVIGSNYSGVPQANVVNHEAVHFYQFAYAPALDRGLPCWFVEGQATLFGNVLEHPVTSQWSDATRVRYQTKARAEKVLGPASKFTSEEWLDRLVDWRTNQNYCRNNELNYTVGLFVWEHLVQTFGTEKLHALVTEMRAGQTWTAASTKVLGITPDELERNASQYLAVEFPKA